MDKNQTTILIVEDDADVAEMLSAYFRVQGYIVIAVNWGEDGIISCQTHYPELVILDINLPDINGFEVAKRLRSDQRTADIPIIFLTEKSDREDRLAGLDLQADDYITKPFDIQELRLRVRNAIARSRRGTLTNPITGLPEGKLVDEELERLLVRRDQRLLFLKLKNLDSFREIYGFVASDDLIRAVILMVQDSINQVIDNDRCFLGHYTPSDLLLMIDDEYVPIVEQKVINRLRQSFTYFYRDQERGNDNFKRKQLDVNLHQFCGNLDKIKNLQQLKTELEQFFLQEYV